MQRIFITFLLLLATRFTFAQNVPTRGFEAWQDTYLPVGFEEWVTSNENFINNGIDSFNVSPSSDAAFGNHSAKLETITYMTDTVIAYIISGGHIEGDSTGLVGYGGAPFTAQPDSMIFWAKYQLPAGDSAFAVVLFKNGGTQYKEVFFFMGGTQPNWTRYSVPMGSYSQAPDSILVGFASGNPDAPYPGGWIQIDEVSFIGTSQNVPNPGLEILDSLSYTNPVGWVSTNNYSVSFGEPQGIQPSTDAHSGQYAMQLEPIYFDAFQGKWGYALTSSTPNNFDGGFYYPHEPTKLSGWYKYSVQSTDTAMIMLTISHEDTLQDTIINLGGGGITLLPTSTYTYFELPVQYNPTYPVNMANVIITPSKAMFGGNPDSVKLGSILLVDDLWLHGSCDWTDTTELFVMDTVSGCSPYNLSAGTGYDTYLWSNGATTSSIDITIDGTYGVTVSDTSGCSVSEDVYVIAVICPGIEDEAFAANLKIYPNPNNGWVFVKQENGNEPLLMSLLSAEGRLIETKTIAATGSISFDLTGLANGMYLLRAEGKAGQYSRILMKQ